MQLNREQARAAYQIGVGLHLIESAILTMPNGRQKNQLWRVRAGNAIASYLNTMADKFEDRHHEDAQSAAAALAQASNLLMPLTPEQRKEWLAECVTPFLAELDTIETQAIQ